MKITDVVMEENEELTVRFKGRWTTIWIDTTNGNVLVRGREGSRSGTKLLMRIEGDDPEAKDATN